MHISQEALDRFIGGQLMIRVPAPSDRRRRNEIRCNITRITVSDKGHVVHGIFFRHPPGDHQIWYADPRISIVVSDLTLHGRRLTGTAMIGQSWPSPMLTLTATIWSSGATKIVEIPIPTRTIEEVLRERPGKYTLACGNGITEKDRGTVLALVPESGDTALPVIMTPFRKFGPDQLWLDSITLEDGVIVLTGAEKWSDGGMSHGSRSAVGRGTTFAEAMANFRTLD